MEKSMASIIESLGVEGINAFYFYVITERLEFIIFLGLATWAIRSAWPFIKKELER